MVGQIGKFSSNASWRKLHDLNIIAKISRGFWSGANGGGGKSYQPHETSYDYDSPVSEAGEHGYHGGVDKSVSCIPLWNPLFISSNITNSDIVLDTLL